MTYFAIAFRNLIQARRRTLLLSTALALVSMLLVLLMALSQGITDTMISSATTLVSGHINVAGFYKPKAADAAPLITKTTEIRKLVRETLPDVRLMTDRMRGWGKLISDTASMQGGMSGIDIVEEQGLRDKITLAIESSYMDGGRDEVVGNIDGLTEENTIMLFQAQAKRLEVTVGDVLTVSTETMKGTVNTLDLRVVAVAQDVGFLSSFSTYMPKSALRELYRLNDDTSGAVLVYLDDVARAEEAMVEVRTALTDAGFRVMDHQGVAFWMKFEQVASEDWVGQKYDVTLWEDEVSYMSWVIDVLDSLSFSLVAVLLLIIIVGIMNTMWIAVRERTNEIGTMRAIGMQRTQVLKMFLAEAFTLGVLATGLGSLVGAGLAFSLNAAEFEIASDAVKIVLMSDTLSLSVTGGQIATAVITITVFTMLAALWPSLRAAKLQPITAIHRVG